MYSQSLKVNLIIIFQSSYYLYIFHGDFFIQSLKCGYKTQGKMQRSLLLCIKMCHVVIQAAQYGLSVTLRQESFYAAVLDKRGLDHYMTQFNTMQQVAARDPCPGGFLYANYVNIYTHG